MELLLKGVAQFHEQYFKPQRELFESLAEGQEPVALFITCSDSRIDPNLLTQTRPGEIFVIRNAGNIVPPYAAGGGEAATIEYAVSVLNIRDVIVCGHTQCGAMKALMRREQAEGLPAVDAWLAHAERSLAELERGRDDVNEIELLRSIIERNVLAQLDNLRTHPAVASRLKDGAARLHGWVYDIERGTVSMHDPAQARFVPAFEPRGAEAPTLFNSTSATA